MVGSFLIEYKCLPDIYASITSFVIFSITLNAFCVVLSHLIHSLILRIFVNLETHLHKVSLLDPRYSLPQTCASLCKGYLASELDPHYIKGYKKKFLPKMTWSVRLVDIHTFGHFTGFSIKIVCFRTVCFFYSNSGTF